MEEMLVKISFKPNNSMKQFHSDENIQKLVQLCIQYCEYNIIEDILILMSVTSLNKFNALISNFENKHLNDGLYDVFLIYKNCFLEIINNKHYKNLKGAFLEVLSLNIFKSFYNYNEVSGDCKIKIDNWISEKTVDIAMICDNSALVCECKIPVSKLSWDIFKNLLEIKEHSNNCISLFAVTLATNIRMEKKKNKIIHTIKECDSLDSIHFITRYDLINVFN